MTNKIYIGGARSNFQEYEVKGDLILFEGEKYYRIANSDQMRSFFMSLVSDSNHWMFISSNGGLTAGRKNSESALFPYYTDDKLTESAEVTGSKTLIRVLKGESTFLWEPFSERYKGIYSSRTNLYKNSLGNKLVFEEVNEDLKLTFRYQWSTSDRFGFVKRSTLVNQDDKNVQLAVLDGIQNILPYGVPSDLQNSRSNLVDAYKKCELQEASGIGIYALSAVIVDRAEPSEALKATSVWSSGLDNPVHLLSSRQLDRFRKGKELEEEVDVRAEKGAYFICADLDLDQGEEKSWITVADVNQSMVQVTEIEGLLADANGIEELVFGDVEKGSKNLFHLNASSDGIQLTADHMMNTRHFANSLFNIMRGGVFDDGYHIEKWDFSGYLKAANKEVYKKKDKLVKQLPERFSLFDLKKLAHEDADANFKRLAMEYMPLKFSRRHGDPSRPWNKFSINTTSELDGSKILDYEGNWRDIFQNWEALAHSYPEFMESMIHKFVNATTFDGYNPYRVTKGGFDWETIEPDDPWSYIGYWGDHQIIYLLKFLEFLEHHHPDRLTSYFGESHFVYANVPYRIKSYQDVLSNPKDTIDFDLEGDARIRSQRDEIGADGALLRNVEGSICHVNFLEKLLATVLAKLSNFIPEGGIWMNTQRPEWNDANNALVGNGVSMVTLYYLRRFLTFFADVIEKMADERIEITSELYEFFNRIYKTFEDHTELLKGSFSDQDRKRVMDGLGLAGSDYRNLIYGEGFTGNTERVSKDELVVFLKVSLQFLDHSIKANKRSDNLFHAYNLMTVENAEEVSISYLPEMLEGQVAVLSSGFLEPESSVELLDALKNSALFRPDQYSYILYPDKDLPRFEAKNNLSPEQVDSSRLLRELLNDKEVSIVERDSKGTCHFNGVFNNGDDLKTALENLPTRYQEMVADEKQLVLNIFESIFDHKSFTGRSGTFFGYEGLGSIYWHMVSKLVLSIQETSLKAMEQGSDPRVIGRLLDHYYESYEGIGVHKSPELYGAFPTDPYSHTPAGKGAQQPGMTGQVKEDVLSRFGELGVRVREGRLIFDPSLLRVEEFLRSEEKFHFLDASNRDRTIELEEGSIGFTYCQVPIIYKQSTESALEVVFENGDVKVFEALSLDRETSLSVFERRGEIERIIVTLNVKTVEN